MIATESEVFSATTHRRYEAGYHDRLVGLSPQSDDPDYFRGYCSRILVEIDRDKAFELDGVA